MIIIVAIHSNEMWTKRPLLVTLAAVNNWGLSIMEVLLELVSELDELGLSRFVISSSLPEGEIVLILPYVVCVLR